MGEKTVKSQSMWSYLRTILIPGFLVITCPLLLHWLAKFAHMDDINMTWTEIVIGNRTSWIISLIAIFWAIFFLKIPSNQYYGPPTYYGLIPRYQDNGFLYYVTTTVTFTIACFIYPSIPKIVYNNIPHLIATLNAIAFILAIILWYKGKYYPEEKENVEQFPMIFEFYRGMELHPRIFNINLKQFTNCRFGVMGWQVLVIAYWFHSYNHFGFNWGIAVNFALQSIYLSKFFWWEAGYFNTIDMVLDRAGFYLCWGCMVFVPGFFVFPAYYLVANPPNLSNSTAITVFIIGLICTILIYLVDYEKLIFRSSNGKRALWSNKPRVVHAEYETSSGKKKSQLLASGFWGMARHFHYGFELVVNYIFGFSGYFDIWPYSLAIFLTVVIFHRLYRDDDKCSKKYGAAWRQYCKLVKYKMIPYVY